MRQEVYSKGKEMHNGMKIKKIKEKQQKSTRTGHSRIKSDEVFITLWAELMEDAGTGSGKEGPHHIFYF